MGFFPKIFHILLLRPPLKLIFTFIIIVASMSWSFMSLIIQYLKEPLRLYGKGDFALTDVKEMDGTQGFLDLDVGIRKCQNYETVLECKAKIYLHVGRKKCSCVPHHLRTFSTAVTFH